jgi:hypothetical protein
MGFFFHVMGFPKGNSGTPRLSSTAAGSRKLRLFRTLTRILSRISWMRRALSSGVGSSASGAPEFGPRR